MTALAPDRAFFATVAPRLERAHRERRIELVTERRARGRARAAEMRAERLVAHRDLQYVRAMAVGNRRYLARRANKLAAAHMELAAARAQSRRLGA